MKARGHVARYRYRHHRLDVVGWDGHVWPFAFNIGDSEPITGRVHQPPPVHQTFEGPGFVVCSFVPRLFDYHPLSIPAPYNHSNVDSDEVIYYVHGDFMSRRGIEPASFTVHPNGIPHGPHPGTYEGSIGKTKTDELAVTIPDLVGRVPPHRRLLRHGDYIAIFSLFAAIVGSVSFWGSNIAFGKLQEIIPGRPITLGAGAADRQPGAAASLAVAAGVDIAAGAHSRSAVHRHARSCAALLGNAVVLPIGGADMPVVISLLNAFTGLSAAATGIALNNPALIVAGMIVGASGTILTNLMAIAMNRSIPAIVAGGLRRRRGRSRAQQAPASTPARCAPPAPPTPRSSSPTPAAW